ncbi:MAG: hypothetical protein HYY02_00820 [Chloroflexi bacterium]|nr:hypothetical protein [Chloroflexota bacterium]
MATHFELVSKLHQYIQRRLKLRELESWLVPRLPMLLEEPESEIGKLTALVELCFAEFQAGIRTERSIRALLTRHLPAPGGNTIRHLADGLPHPLGRY